jgi:hypothetical protein
VTMRSLQSFDVVSISLLIQLAKFEERDKLNHAHLLLDCRKELLASCFRLPKYLMRLMSRQVKGERSLSLGGTLDKPPKLIS